MSLTDRAAVTWHVDERLLVVTIDNPPVNALSHAVRDGIVRAANLLDADASLDAMVVRSTGSIFVGGADIREFGGPRMEPLLNSVCDRLEGSTKPVVAALQGAALGGGFELALASHARIASPQAVVAFPEVLLGLLPGAGGTQRASRLCGAALALDLMLMGKRMTAAEAVAAGLIDEVAANPIMRAMELARHLVAAKAPLRRARDGTALREAERQHAAIQAAMASMPADPSYRFARERIVRCVTAAVEQPYENGAEVEANAFLECLASPQREQLVQQFLAERAGRKAARAE